MKSLTRMLALAVLGVATLVTSGNLYAQQGPPGGGQGGPGGRNFDPEQMRQRMMERYREQFEVKSDDEWKIIEERITKVNDARREVGFGGGMGGRMFRQNRDGGGDQAQGGQQRRAFGGEPNPDAEALQKAIDAKASSDEIKAKLAKYRESRKAKQAKLASAQDDLRKVLTVRQEATAVLMGLLD